MIKAAYIMPHPPILLSEIGEGAEMACQNTLDALRKVALEIKAIKPKTIIVITPHGPVFSDGLVIGYGDILKGHLGKFNHENIGLIKDNNMPLVDKIIYESGKIDMPVLKLDEENAEYFAIDMSLDHGTIVPLKFIEEVYSDYQLVQITYGLFDSIKLYEFGMLLKELVEEDTVIIASGDLSHALKEKGPYKLHPDGAIYDEMLSELLVNKSLEDLMFFDQQLQENASECGKRSIDVLLGSLDGSNYEVKRHSYEGPYGVGYLVMSFNDIKDDGDTQLTSLRQMQKEKQAESISNESHFVALARRAIENYLDVNDTVMDDTLTREMLDTKAGVFVTLKKQGALRGCMGTIGPTEDNVALEIVSNAIKAGFEDPRFPELIEEELKEMTISVDILMHAEVVNDISELDVLKYGVIVSTNYKRGLLLPNLESIDTVEEQLRIACQKGSIDPNEDYKLERFEVVRYH